MQTQEQKSAATVARDGRLQSIFSFLLKRQSKEDAAAWRDRFLAAVPEAADVKSAVDRFMVAMLVDDDIGVLQFADDRGRATVEIVEALYCRRWSEDEPAQNEWISDAITDAALAASNAQDRHDKAYYRGHAYNNKTVSENTAIYAAYSAAVAADADAATAECNAIGADVLLGDVCPQAYAAADVCKYVIATHGYAADVAAELFARRLADRLCAELTALGAERDGRE